jgi:putative transposase
MTNHVHLVVQVGEVPLSRILQNLSFRYTRFINHRKQQTGHLFQGRYKALLLDADTYLLELVRYIHNNPVRAQMVPSPEEYPWSSHSAYLGNISVPWLTTDWVLARFAGEKEKAVELYRQFVVQRMDEAHRKEFYRGNIEGQVLGDDHFAERAFAEASGKMLRQTTLDHVIQTVCEHYGISQDELCSGSRQKRISEPRAVTALLVRDLEYLQLTTLSRKLKRDLSGLSQAAGRLDQRLKSDKELEDKVNSIRELFLQYPFVKPDPPSNSSYPSLKLNYSLVQAF